MTVVIQMLYWTVVVERAEQKGKSFISCVLTLIYGHEFWVVTEKNVLLIQTAEMHPLCRIAALTFRDSVRSSDIRR